MLVEGQFRESIAAQSVLALFPPTSKKGSANRIEMLLLWHRVVTQLLPNTQYAFPSLDRIQMKHSERRVSLAAQTLGYCLPNITAFRKVVEIRNKRLEESVWQAVSGALSHSSATATCAKR